MCTNTLLPLRFELGGEVMPMKLPRGERQPVALELLGRVATTDGTHPPALREMTLELDRDFAIDLKGVPVCRPAPQYDMRRPPGELRQRCRSSIVGGGKVDLEIAFPEQHPIQEQSAVTIYNGGLRNGAQTLHAYVLIHVPVPAEIVFTIEIKRVRQGPYGSQAVVEIPVIAGGSGSLIDFDLRVKRLFELGGVRRSVVTAKCPDGRLDVGAESLFENEAHVPGEMSTTTMSGNIAIPCHPAS